MRRTSTAEPALISTSGICYPLVCCEFHHLWYYVTMVLVHFLVALFVSSVYPQMFFCLIWYHFWFLYTGTGAPYLVDVVKEDGEHLEVGKIPHSKLSTVV